MLIFGGLVHENVRNDMWSIDVRDLSTLPVKTMGDAPPARVGHASAIADRIMIVWGGDTKVRKEDPQDEGLYVLDLRKSSPPQIASIMPLIAQGRKNGRGSRCSLAPSGGTVMRPAWWTRGSSSSVDRRKDRS